MPITFGASSAPSQITQNLDSVFSTSLANYKQTLADNISTSNAFFYELKRRGFWESRDGGAYIAEDLLYELGQADTYDGYDELADTPTDGITQVLYQWRQAAVPISYSEKERKMNKHRIVNLVKAKIRQAEQGIIELFNKMLLQGGLAGSGSSLVDPYQSGVTGAYGIEPLGSLVSLDVTTSRDIGNINQASNTWWRNRTKTSTATTFSEFLAEWDNMYNTCARGPYGPPNLIICDQTTYELLNQAYYIKYRTQIPSDGNYPFENLKFRKAHVIFDEFVPDVFSNVANTNTYGTAWFLNVETFRVAVEAETDFTMTPFAKPPKGDSRLAHILFMGNTTINNRRKNGVIGRIARTLSGS